MSEILVSAGIIVGFIIKHEPGLVNFNRYLCHLTFQKHALKRFLSLLPAFY
jgi:hypothetical protein